MNIKRIYKNGISWILIFCLLLGQIPMEVFASDIIIENKDNVKYWQENEILIEDELENDIIEANTLSNSFGNNESVGALSELSEVFNTGILEDWTWKVSNELKNVYELRIDGQVYECDNYFEEHYDLLAFSDRHSTPCYINYGLISNKIHSMEYIRPYKDKSLEEIGVWVSPTQITSESDRYIFEQKNKLQDAFNNLMKKTADVLSEEAEKAEDKDAQAKESFVDALTNAGVVFTFEGTWPREWSKEEIYEAFAEEILEVANRKASYRDINGLDATSFASEIANSVCRAYIHIKKTVESSDKTKEYHFSITGIYGSFDGQIFCESKKNKTDNHIVKISMSKEQMDKVLSIYTKELATLSMNTANMVYATMANEILGSSISSRAQEK